MGVYDLGLTAAHFWSLTPREFMLLWGRHVDRERREDARWATMFAMYANAHRDENKHPTPFRVEDFLPDAPPAREMTGEEFMRREAARAPSAAVQAANFAAYMETWKAVNPRP